MGECRALSEVQEVKREAGRQAKTNQTPLATFKHEHESPSTATRLEAGGGGIGILCRVICGLGTEQETGDRRTGEQDLQETDRTV